MDKHDVRGAFATLFRGRIDAFGTDEGGAYRVAEHGGGVLEQHLRGDRVFGVYPIFDEYLYCDCDTYASCDHDPRNLGSHVRWGCVDFDIKSDAHVSYDYETEDEAHVAATDLQRVLAALGITAWIERTRSHGRHVWVFARVPVPAATMRRALLVACNVAEVSAREVNPKSEVLAPDQLGNYVRCVYPNGENEWSLDADEPRLAGGSVGGGGLLLHQPQAQRSHGTGTDPHPSVATDDRPGRSATRCGYCGSRWRSELAAKPRAADNEQPRHGQPETDVSLARPVLGASVRADGGAVPVDGRATPGEDPRVPTRVALMSDPEAQPICLACFVERAYASRVAPDVLTEIAAHWQPPPEIVLRPVAPYQGALRDITTKLDGQGFVVFRDGPTTGDRSGGLVYLAHSCARSGLTHDECVTLLLDADARWGKFSKRHDCERQIGLIAGRAYG